MIQEYEVKEIITDLDVLSDWSEVIHPKKEGKLCQQIIGELKATMRAYKLEYLTAPQIGYKKKIFCVRYGKNDYRSYINPTISNNIGITIARETCNSIPDKTFIIPRFNKVELIYFKPLRDDPEACVASGRTAQIFSHCVEHLEGTLTSDIGLEIDEMFDNASEEDREQVIKMYLESLDLRTKAMQEEIENDEELKKMNDAINFMESVRKGETILESVDTKEEDNEQR